MATELIGDRMLGASSFNFTPDIVEARRSAGEITAGIVQSGVAQVIELEPGSIWRSFPAPSNDEVDALRDALAAAGGRVSIVGLSIDEFASPTRRRTGAERLQFLLPQLRAARRIGATGVRLPIGQAGRPLLDELVPLLDEFDLTLFEEIQGQQAPSNPVTARALDTIAELDSARVRVLVDISMLMPALPVTYLQRLADSPLPREFVSRVATGWREQGTADAVLGLLRSGDVPPGIHTLFMNMVVRFGRSEAAELREILPLVGAFHLKFWDLDDADARVSGPLADLGALLAGTGFSGSLTSEWGGHEWLEGWDAAETTTAHLALAREALGSF